MRRFVQAAALALVAAQAVDAVEPVRMTAVERRRLVLELMRADGTLDAFSRHVDRLVATCEAATRGHLEPRVCVSAADGLDLEGARRRIALAYEAALTDAELRDAAAHLLSPELTELRAKLPALAAEQRRLVDAWVRDAARVAATPAPLDAEAPPAPPDPPAWVARILAVTDLPDREALRRLLVDAAHEATGVPVERLGASDLRGRLDASVAALEAAVVTVFPGGEAIATALDGEAAHRHADLVARLERPLHEVALGLAEEFDTALAKAAPGTR